MSAPTPTASKSLKKRESDFTDRSSGSCSPPLEAVVCTERLKQRLARPPDYQTENQALVALTLAMADAPRSVFRTLADTLQDLLGAGSVVVSLLSRDQTRFDWTAVAGLWQAHTGHSTLRDCCPCAEVLDCNAPVLFRRPGRHYACFETLMPMAEECLVVPLRINGQAVGTIWLVAHDDHRQFDAEDLRQLESLSRVAAATYQVVKALDAMGDSEGEAFSRSLIDSSPDCVKVLDLRGNLLSIKSGKELLGIEDIRPFLSKSWIDFWTGDDRIHAQTAIDSAVAGRTGTFVGFFRTQRGEAKWWDVAISPIRETGGKPARLLAVSRDVTQRKQAEDALQASEQRGRLALDAAKLGTFHLDLVLGTFTTDEGFRTIFGWTGPLLDYEQAIGVIHPDDQRRVFDAVAAAIRPIDPAPFAEEYRVKHPDGIVHWVTGTGRVNRDSETNGATGQPLSLDGTVADITERKHFEEALSRRTAQFETLFNSAPLGAYLVDADFRVRQVNPTALPTFGNIADLKGRDFAEVMHILWPAEKADEIVGRFRHTLETGEAFHVAEMIEKRADRHATEYYEWQIERIPLPDGPYGVVCYFRDISGQVLAQEEIRQSEMRFRAFVTASADVVYRMSADWMEMRQLHGRSFMVDSDKPSSNWMDEYLFAQDRPMILAAIEQAIQTKSIFELEHPVRRADGSAGWTNSRAVPLLDANGGISEWFGTATDITERRRTEQALSESEGRYRDLLNSTNEGYCVIELIFDAEGQPVDYSYVEVNPSFENLTGLHGVLGKRVREFVPDLEAHWFETFGQVALTGESVRFFNEAKSMNRWFDVHAFRLGGTESRQVAILFNNITPQKVAENALRESEALYRSLFNSINEGFCIIEMIFDTENVAVDYRFLEVNPVFAAQCGLLDAPGKRMRELLPDHEEFWYELYGTVALTGEPVQVQAEAKALHAWFDLQAFRIGGPGSRKVAVIFNNITERRESERKLHEQAATLADQARRKDEFLAMLSHELRNPLAPLTNAVHILRLQANENPIQRQARSIIERQVGQLKHLVGDLLEISRITTGRVQLRREQIALSGVVERAIETTQPLIEHRRHALMVSLPPQHVWLFADASRLEQVVVNLLTNAAKYTDEGGRIWLTVQQEAGPNGLEAVLRVRDTGIGIAPELLPRIFDLFTQADRSLDRSEGGLGIGLCLVRRLVDLHGGSVTVSSVPGKGSEFVVRLPSMPLEPPQLRSPARSAPVSEPSERGCRVLVVDDNVDAAQSLADLLGLNGHEVRMAHDGPSALAAVRQFRADLVLLDIGLPGLTGLQVAQRIRQLPELDGIVLAAMTGYGQDSDQQRSRDAGFDHHLVKPADFSEIEKILETIQSAA